MDDIDLAIVAAAQGRRGPATNTTATSSGSSHTTSARTHSGRLDAGTSSASAGRPGVQQPKPQALPQRAGPSSILVNSRQKGNPVLNHIKNMPWEYAEIPADFVLGATTCALFLSLKYHKLHPEYIYSRIRALQGKYNLRVLLTLVDIQNHEESLKELSKTSMINNVTIILCWKAEEAGRYLELYKQYEYTAPTGIRAHQATSYSDRLVEFVTIPRGVNKTDAVSLVSNFGSIRTAVNAQPEEIALISGWGEKKVERWCRAVREPFRLKKAARRGLNRDDTQASSMGLSREATRIEDEDDAEAITNRRVGHTIRPEDALNPPQAIRDDPVPDAERRPPVRQAEEEDNRMNLDEEEVMRELRAPPAPAPAPTKPNPKKRPAEPEVSDGVMAALAKLRQG